MYRVLIFSKGVAVKRLMVCFTILLIAATLFTLGGTVRAQTLQEPTALIDAILRDLSARLGITLSRVNINYQYSLNVYPSAALGCPEPGKVYAQSQTKGWQVIINPFAGGSYDYRAPDETHFWLCKPGGSSGTSAPTQVPAINGQKLPAPPAPSFILSSQPTNYQEPIAFVGYDGNVYISDIANLSDHKATALTGDAQGKPTAQFPFYQKQRYYGHFRWSPDGSRLAFTEQRSGDVYIAATSSAPVKVAQTSPLGFPPTWSPDGSQLAFAVMSNQTVGNDAVMQIQAVPSTGGLPHAVSSFTFGGGCGGGSDNPDIPLYYDEAGYEGNAYSLVWTAQGFVTATNCVGAGLRLTDLGGSKVWELPKLSRVAISSDRTHAVGLNGDLRQGPAAGVIVDVANGTVTQFSTPANADQFAWTLDGKQIIYSTQGQAQAITLNLQSPYASSVPSSYASEKLPNNIVSLWLMSITGDQPVQLYNNQQAYQIGRISVGRAGSPVMFSVVKATGVLVKLINENASLDQLLAAVPGVKLVTVSTNPGSAKAGYPPPFDGGQPSFSPVGAFLAVPASIINVTILTPVPPANTGGSGVLTVGGQATVNVQLGDSLNLRESPTTAARVLRTLKSQELVTLLAGPQSNDGLRWWQVRAEQDGAVGWVADQVIQNGIQETTLIPR